MSRLNWNTAFGKTYETGVDRGVLYLGIDSGLPWDGLIGVKENSGGLGFESKSVEGITMRTPVSIDSFSATIEAFSSPAEFDDYDGTNDDKLKTFGFSYRSFVQNDSGEAVSYKIHLIYNALARQLSMDYSTITSGSVDLRPFSWDLVTLPTEIPEFNPTSHLIIDSSLAYPSAMQAIEEILYGSDETYAHLPSVLELIDVFEQNAILRIIDNGDGTWTAIGPDDVVKMLDATTFQIDWPSVEYLDENTYKIRSL